MLKRIPHSEEHVTTIQDPAEYYERHKATGVRRFKPFLKWLVKTNSSGEYLEVGAGPGILAALLAKSISDVQITAVEPDPRMIQIGEKHIKDAGAGNKVRFVQGAGEDRDLITSLGQFDLVYSTFSLHHWKEPVQVLRLIYQSIREDGAAVIFDFKRVWWMYYYPSKNGLFNPIRASYTKNDIKKMMNEAGISEYQIITPFPYFWQLIVVKK